jgi:hypothetical protein
MKCSHQLLITWRVNLATQNAIKFITGLLLAENKGVDPNDK